MKRGIRNNEILMIDIGRINILNPRARNQKTFFDIATNITKVGLKRPITVTPCKSKAPGKDYDLVCGQGRLEAFLACGQKEIPALVIEANEEETLIMSLVENLARRKHRTPELLQAIEILRKQNYDAKSISKKTGLSLDYVEGICNLMDKGEQRLVAAVEAGHMPLSLAINIANSPSDEQQALQDAYESKELRGNRLLQAKKLLSTRKRCGKQFDTSPRKQRNTGENRQSAQSVLRTYRKEVDRKKLLARKANRASQTLLFVRHALQDLLSDPDFKKLLQSEKLLTLPKPLAELLNEKSGAHG